MQVVIGNTALLLPASDETQSLVLHYPTPSGVMQLTSKPEQGKRCIIVQGNKESKSDILYVVENEKHVAAAADRVRRSLGVKQSDMVHATIERVHRIEGTATLSILVSLVAEGKKHHAHYFSQDYYDDTVAVIWKTNDHSEPRLDEMELENE